MALSDLTDSTTARRSTTSNQIYGGLYGKNASRASLSPEGAL